MPYALCCRILPRKMNTTVVGPEYAEWLRAREHYEAACALSWAGKPDVLNHPNWQCQILCTSIEVALKAFLLAKKIGGTDAGAREKLKDNFGHNLQKLLGRATYEGLTEFVKITERDVERIRMANPFYMERDWIYAEKRGFASYPAPHELRDLAVRILDGICEVVKPRAVGR